MPSDPLDRFVRAQADCIGSVISELAAGRKQGHWMWFVFPQLIGLGRSEMALYYGIAGLLEARTYLAHPLLGPRYDECCRTVAYWAGKRSAEDIFGSVDALKLRSSLTLMERASALPGSTLYAGPLDAFFEGERDPQTLRLLSMAA